jgi:WD40 repeat protein
VWDAATGKRVSVFGGPDDYVEQGMFSSDGRLVLTTGLQAARVREAESGDLVASVSGHGNILQNKTLVAASLTPDGALMITAWSDDTTQVWDATTGEQVAVLGSGCSTCHQPSQLSVSPDGKLIAAVRHDESVPDSTRSRLDPFVTHIYACEECGTLADLRRLADERIERTLTRRERERFLRATAGG